MTPRSDSARPMRRPQSSAGSVPPPSLSRIASRPAKWSATRRAARASADDPIVSESRAARSSASRDACCRSSSLIGQLRGAKPSAFAPAFRACPSAPRAEPVSVTVSHRATADPGSTHGTGNPQETPMKTIKTTTLALALAAAVGTLSLAATPASAKGFHGGGFNGGHHGGGFGGGYKYGGNWGHGHWGHRRHYGWGYGYGIAASAADCSLVRRYGELIKVCE